MHLKSSLSLALSVLVSMTVAVRSAPTANDELEHMVNKVGGPEFAGLKIMVMRAKSPGTGISDLDSAAAFALSTDCSEELTHESFDRLYKSNFEDRCAEILPVFDQHVQEIARRVQRVGQQRETMLYFIGLACRHLIKPERKQEIGRRFSALLRAESMVSQRTCCTNIPARQSQVDEEAGNQCYELRRGPGAGISHVDTSQPEDADRVSADEDFIMVEPSEFAVSDTHETHGPNFNYEDEEYMMVGRPSKAHD